MGIVPGTRQDPDPRVQTPCTEPTVARAPTAGRGKYPTICKRDKRKKEKKKKKTTSKMVINFLRF